MTFLEFGNHGMKDLIYGPTYLTVPDIPWTITLYCTIAIADAKYYLLSFIYTVQYLTIK